MSDERKERAPATRTRTKNQQSPLRTRGLARDSTSAAKFERYRVLRSTMKRPPPTKHVGGQGQQQHRVAGRLLMPALVDGQQSPTSVFWHLSPLCARSHPADNGERCQKTVLRNTYGKGGATLPFSVDVLFLRVTQKTTAEPLAGEGRRLVQNLIL